MLSTLYKAPTFTVTYLDDENELITISSDMELKEAFDVAKASGLSTLKLFVEESVKPALKLVSEGRAIAKPSTPVPPQQTDSTGGTEVKLQPIETVSLCPETDIKSAAPTPVSPTSASSFQCVAPCCSSRKSSSSASSHGHVLCSGPCCSQKPLETVNSGLSSVTVLTHICNGSCCRPAVSVSVSKNIPDLSGEMAGSMVTPLSGSKVTPLSGSLNVAAGPAVPVIPVSTVVSSNTATNPKFQAQHESLAAMGFTNAELNEFLLEHNKGHVGEVVNWLLAHGPNRP